MKRTKRGLALLLSILLLFSSINVVVFAASGDTTVYRTKTGDCYHKKGCSYLRSSIKLTLQEAVNMGLRPCSRCHPPELTSSSRSSGSGTGGGTKFKVTITATCTSNNSVGNDWVKTFSVDGDTIKSGDIVAFHKNDKLKIYTKIIEHDNGKNDVGDKTTTHKVTSTEFSNGFTVTQTITVVENGGRYDGNTATWKVKYKFTRYKK